MSMPKIEKSENFVDRNQSVSDLIESVALMETGLSHIINAEGEKIQKVIKADDPTSDVPIEDIVNINNSVERMVNTVSKLEMILQNKLDISKDLDINPLSPIIEGTIIPYTGNISVSSYEDGVPGSLSAIVFGTIYPISISQYDDINSLPIETVTFPMPRSGNITDFSVFFEFEDGGGPQIRLFAKIYKASAGNLYSTPVKDAVVEITIPEQAQSGYQAYGNVSLNTPISVNDKLFIVFYCSCIGEITTIEGKIGAGINIK